MEDHEHTTENTPALVHLVSDLYTHAYLKNTHAWDTGEREPIKLSQLFGELPTFSPSLPGQGTPSCFLCQWSVWRRADRGAAAVCDYCMHTTEQILPPGRL